MSLSLLPFLAVSIAPWLAPLSRVLAKELPVPGTGPASGKGNHTLALGGEETKEIDKKHDQPDKSQGSL